MRAAVLASFGSVTHLELEISPKGIPRSADLVLKFKSRRTERVAVKRCLKEIKSDWGWRNARSLADSGLVTFGRIPKIRRSAFRQNARRVAKMK